MQRGFSLIELSIVLVILGLLTGGILAGQSLIRAAELRSVSTDTMRYQTAVYSFRDKYFALPGDMTNAQSFWNVRVAGSNLVCQQTVNVSTGTCNSDGNGIIDFITGDATLSSERVLAWQHLALAGLVEGSYTGASMSASTFTYQAGVNVPRGRLANSSYYFAYIGVPSGGNPEFYGASWASNMMQLMGGANGASNRLLKPEEMWNIDMKMDDGKPAQGVVIANKTTGTYAPGCTTADTLAAEYTLTATDKLCTLWLLLR
jgi:prepilin-type N-terminal cleavage/methylation domain-containing protein